MIFCNILDGQGSETKDDTDDVSHEPICQQSSDVHQNLDVLIEYMLFSDNGEFIHKYLKKNQCISRKRIINKTDIS